MSWMGLVLMHISGSAAFAETSVADQAAKVRSDQPDVAAVVDSLEPMRNRAGGVYFPGGLPDSASAQVLVLDKVMHGDDPMRVRVALANGLVEPQPWERIAGLPIPLRVAMLEGHKRSADPTALIAATRDSSGDVAATAVRLLGYADRGDAAGVSAALIRSLSNGSGEVRRYAARSLGWRGDGQAFAHIVPLLADGRPGVRESAVRALGKLDRDRARSLRAMVVLANDPHPGTARAAAKLLAAE